MKNKNWPLIIGISLPFICIVIVSLAIFLPSISVNPEYNFIYSDDRRYYYDINNQDFYRIEAGRLVVNPESEKYYLTNKIPSPKIYLYNVKLDIVTELSLAEAQQLSLQIGPSSPDGYTVSYLYGHNGIFELFGSSNNDNGFFIQKGNAKKKLSAVNNDGRYYGYGDLRVIGWVK